MSDTTTTLTEQDVLTGVNVNMLSQATDMENRASQLQRNAASVRSAAAKIAALVADGARSSGTTSLTTATLNGVSGATSSPTTSAPLTS